MSEMDIERLKTILQESDYVHAGKWTGEAVDIEGLIDVALETLAAQEKRIAELTAANERLRTIMSEHAGKCRGWFGENQSWKNEMFPVKEAQGGRKAIQHGQE